MFCLYAGRHFSSLHMEQGIKPAISHEKPNCSPFQCLCLNYFPPIMIAYLLTPKESGLEKATNIAVVS